MKQLRLILLWSLRLGAWNKLSRGSREGSFWGFPRILSVLSLWQHPPNSSMYLTVYRFASSLKQSKGHPRPVTSSQMIVSAMTLFAANVTPAGPVGDTGVACETVQPSTELLRSL